MRIRVLLYLVGILPANGCTYAVVSSGTKLSELTTAEQVRAEFGPPTDSGVADGKPYEEFRTRRKIAEPNKVMYVVMGDIVTFGFGELIWFPQQSFLAARRSIRGQTLRFVYDEGGKVTAVTHDEERVIWAPQPPSPPASAAAPTRVDGGRDEPTGGPLGSVGSTIGREGRGELAP